VPSESDEKQETLICALVTKSMFMDSIVTLVQEKRKLPARINAWKLHTEVGQLLQQISGDLSSSVSESRYCELWESCETKLTNVQLSGIAKPPSLYTDLRSGISWSSTTPERSIHRDDRRGAISAFSPESTSQLTTDLHSAIHSHGQSRPPQIPESQRVIPSVARPSDRSSSHYQPITHELRLPRPSHELDLRAPTIAVSRAYVAKANPLYAPPPAITRLPGQTRALPPSQANIRSHHRRMKAEEQVIDHNDSHAKAKDDNDNDSEEDDNDDDDDDDESDDDLDEFPFTNLQSEVCQLFTKIPLPDFAQRVWFLDNNRELLAEDTVAAVQKEFLKQSVDFARVGEITATMSCICSLALLVVSKNERYLGTFFHELLLRESAGKKRWGVIVTALNSLVEQKAPLDKPLPIPQWNH